MLRKCTVFVLLLTFTVMTFSRTVIFVDFYAHQEYIVKNLCENRNKPGLNCCGKCQLRKRLARQDSQDKNNPERRVENRSEILLSDHFFRNSEPPFSSVTTTPYFIPFVEKPIDQPGSFFHPPSC
ncbi:MAG: hypothetical protein P4L51_05570 [Puia sp.]|nr:hypothetical protein [Puia sp.]